MNRQGPRLKNGVDLQLQSAYNDGNWPVVIRLAEKRARTLNDQYFEVVKIFAETQLDDPGAKFAAVAAVWRYVKNGVVVKDVDAIELLEWAAQKLMHEHDFAETLGPLRVRAVKAAPKDKRTATRCLESCLLHWDLNSAQQIAAIADRSFPQERSFLFWNIVITHMLSTSSQAAPEKKKLYGTLAQKQIERAAQTTEQAETAPKDGQSKAPTRGIQTEEEVLLLYDVVETHGTAQDFEKLVSSPVFSPIVQFRQGRKELLLRAVEKYSRDGDWAAVLKLCRGCLYETDDDGQPTLLASDIVVWRHLISAAGHLQSADLGAQKDVQDLLTKLLASKHLSPMYRRNILLARVSAVFSLGPSDENDLLDGRPMSLRLQELINYVSDQADNGACFNDVRSFLERLDGPGLKYLAYDHLPGLSNAASPDLRSARTLLSLKTQYFSLTHDSMYSRFSDQDNGLRCIICESKAESAPCRACLSQLSRTGVDLYRALANSAGDSNTAAKILPELAILLAFCSLNLAFQASQPIGGPLSSTATRHLLHAVLLLEEQLGRNLGHSQISLILVQLHLYLGSAFRASKIWDRIGVKRTIIDSLAPIFYDRLSTISPSLMSPSASWGRHLMDLIKSHYHVSLKLRMPRRLGDAFEAESYSSVMGIPKYIEDLRASCTRVMSLVEGRRVERALGMPSEELSTDARFYEVDDDVYLREVIDYGSFPSWASSTSQPMHLRLRLGPALSKRRCHLSLLSETFHDLLSYKLPSSYKVSTASSEADHIFVMETMTRLSNSFPKFLMGPDGEFTSSEMVYFEAVSLLSTLVLLCVGIDRSAPLPDVLDQLVDALKASVENQRAHIMRHDESSIGHTVTMLGSMHDIAMLRDTAIAMKLTAQWILNFNEGEKQRDRSGRSSLPKEVVAQVKDLQSTAEAVLKEGHGWIADLKADVMSRDFELKLKRWIFDGEGEVGSILSAGSLPALVESWQANVKGWLQVKWA